MSTLMLSAKLDRSDSSTPWGFRMHGGKDFGAPLTIQRVTPGSLASKCGLQVGDVILRIGESPVDMLVHKEAQARIIQSANFLELTLQRRGHADAQSGDALTQGNLKTTHGGGSPATQRATGRPYSPSPLATGQPAFQQPSPGAQDYNRSAQPFPSQGSVPVAMNNQYNTPVNMYSVDNAMGTLAAQTGALNISGPSQGTGRSPGSLSSHGVVSGSSPLHGTAHVYSHSHSSPTQRLINESENGANSRTHEFHFTDAHKPPTEKWTLASNTSPISIPEKSPDVKDNTFTPAFGLRKAQSPPSHSARPGGKSAHRKITPIPHDVNPVRKGITSSRFEEVKEGEEIRYHGYTNPEMQSQSFKIIQETLERGEEPPSLGTIGSSPSEMRPRSPDEPPQTVRSSPFRPSGAVPQSRQYNSPVGLYGRVLNNPEISGHYERIVEKPENGADETDAGTTITPSRLPETFKTTKFKGPTPWGTKDTATPQYRKMSDVKLNSESPSMTSNPAKATIQSLTDQNSPTITGYVVHHTPSTVTASPQTTPSWGKTVTSMNTPSSGAHGSDIIPTARRNTPPQSMPTSARWLLGGLAAVSQNGNSAHSPRAEPCGTGTVTDSDSVQYVEVKVYPSSQTASSAPAPGGGRLSPRPVSPARAQSPRGLWQPQVPSGPRKMRSFMPGSAKSMPGVTSGVKVPICDNCGIAIRGPFVLALDKSWCPDHFNCSNPHCKTPLIGIGFVEENGQLFCERDYEKYFAPRCGKCGNAIMRECVNALKDTFHPECFLCFHCNKPIGSGSFHIEDGKNYCEKDWQAMFQTKCYGCQFPIEPGDRWVEALNQNWHSECFNCSTCQVNLEGQGFYAKQGKPYCKKHAARF